MFLFFMLDFISNKLTKQEYNEAAPMFPILWKTYIDG